MKKLKNKILITIFTILSISMLIILTFYNSTDYIREKINIEDNLNKMINNYEEKFFNNPPLEKKDIIFQEQNKYGEPKKFIDKNIYTIIINNKSIEKIISHTDEETIPSDIEEIVEKIIDKNDKSKIYIGNLYINKYSYNYKVDGNIVLIDNTKTIKKLRTTLISSIIILIIFELIAYVISNKISSWIIEPVDESFKKQKQFIADASHELKTPLSVIIASADALENSNDEKWLKNIQSESERMNKLIKDLLDLAKIENDELPKNYEEIDLSKTSEMAILPLESLIFEKNIKLEYNIEEKIKYNSISSEIKQLITILMDNAIKHTKKNGKIIFNLKKLKDDIKLEVINEGNPIPNGEEEKIFERFYRIDKSRNRNENRYGLGLAIAKGIVQRHKGTIKAYSKDGYTTFEVIFKK